MNYEIRDIDEAHRFVVQGLWLSRVSPPDPDNVHNSLNWCYALASTGYPLPVTGFVADVASLAKYASPVVSSNEIPNVSADELRRYDEYVLGKLAADFTFAQGIEACRRYQDEQRVVALTFLIHQLGQRAKLPRALLSPGVIQTLLKEDPVEVLESGWQSLEQGLCPHIAQHFPGLAPAIRLMGDALGREDIFELETGTALDDFGQRVALRQVVAASAELEKQLPNHRPRATVTHRNVATNVADEDFYPVGGYSSLSNRGTVESLLRSELMYIDRDQRPDLFDIKFARDELLYYSRDENQFFRERRTFVFLFAADIATTRYKDVDLPWQRIILALSLAVAAQRTMTNWLGDQALNFHFAFLTDARFDEPREEAALIERTFVYDREFVDVHTQPQKQEIIDLCEIAATQSLCHCLWLTAKQPAPRVERPTMSSLTIGRTPRLTLADTEVDLDETSLDGWAEALNRVLRFWL